MYPNLKLQLWKTGIRQNRLAQMIGVDETILSKIVNGFREPTPQLRERIAALLHSDVDWLFEPVKAESGLKDTPTPANGQDGAARKKSA
jgi:transcriptional regulator with XRE-family HTH domain